MLQLHDTMNKTFTRITQAPAPTRDFVSRNKRAVRNISKSKQNASLSNSLRPHPPATKPASLYAQRNRRPPAATVAAGQNNASSGDVLDTTVVISKSYLEHLLRTSLNGTVKEPIQAKDSHPQQPGYETAQISGMSTLPLATAETVPTATTTVGPQARIKARKQESPVDYFPFGRPGCGAPLRTDSGQVMADLRQRSRPQGFTTTLPPGHFSNLAQETPSVLPSVLQPTLSQPATEGGGELTQSTEMTSPRYARGAGPHVNQYVLKDKEDKRKKELEHVEYLKAQITAKQNAKRTEKEKAEREEREAEARFLRDRQKMQEEQAREAEKAKRKEEEARQRQALIQQAIDKAAEAALRERQRAKSLQHGHTRNPRGSRSPTGTVAQQADLRRARNVYNSGDNVSAPSMLKLNSKVDVLSSGCIEQVQVIQKRQGSRIPVRSKGPGRSRPHDTPNSVQRRPKQPQASSSKSRTMQKHTNTSSSKSQEMAWTTPIRATSPPVPTLAKRLQHAEIPQHQHHRAIPTTVPRAQSPPVPALAKKLKYGVTADEGRAAMPQPARDTPPPLRLPPVHSGTGTHQIVARSPPVPALRKGTQQEATRLPPLIITEAAEEAHPPQDILKQLVELRKGLLSHRSTVDRKLEALFH